MCSSTAILVRNRGLGTARFAELAAGAGVRAYGVPSHAGGLPTNTGERWGGEKWTNAGIRPIWGWANRRLGVTGCPPNGHLYDLPVMGSFGLFEWGGGFAPRIIRTQK